MFKPNVFGCMPSSGLKKKLFTMFIVSWRREIPQNLTSFAELTTEIQTVSPWLSFTEVWYSSDVYRLSIVTGVCDFIIPLVETPR